MEERKFEIKCLNCKSINTEIEAITTNGMMLVKSVTEIEISCRDCGESTRVLYKK